MARAAAWRTFDAEALSHESLRALCRAQVPAVYVPGLLESEECDRVMQALPGDAFKRYARKPAFQTFERFGIAQAGYGAAQRDLYFEAVSAARAERDAVIAAAGIDPLARAIDRLRTHAAADIAVAREADGREYYAGIVRRLNAGVELHVDCCRRADRRWLIHANVAQLSLNVYLTSFNGGGCVVHDRVREEADDSTVPRGSYIYDRALIAGARSCRMQPRKGDLLLINSHCYHEVEAADSDRVTYAAFVGLLPDGRFVVWA